MGWWRSGGGGLIGDRPVDIMLHAFRDLKRCHALVGQHPPPEWLRELVARAIASRRLELGDLADEATDADTTSIQPTNAEISAIADALEQIVTEYEDSELDRRPTPAELRATVDFAIAELR